MLYKLGDKYRRWVYSHACRGVLETHPVRTSSDSNVALLTQLQHKDVMMALVAFKAFASRVPVGALYVLDDGSLTSRDKAILKAHLPTVTILQAADVRSSACPAGGCWERLLTISELVEDYYVIQLDSDTLPIADLPEVRDCISRKESFVIGTWDHQDFESMSERQKRAARIEAENRVNSHIQIAAEANFHKLAGYETLRYVRGCAGFSGFGRGSFDRAFVEEISAQMRRAIGDRWNKWGSEQVMSNIVVANSASARVLPHPKYCDCTKVKPGETVFVHFIGSCRFQGGVYARLTRRVVAELAAT